MCLPSFLSLSLENLILLPILAAFPRIFRFFILATVQKKGKGAKKLAKNHSYMLLYLYKTSLCV